MPQHKSEKYVALEAKTYESMTQELAALRQRVAELEQAQSPDPNQAAQQKALLAVVSKISESLDLESIFQATATEVRQLLNADRVGMYRFDHDSGYRCGEFVSENVLPEFSSAIAAKIDDHCFGEKYADYYKYGRIWACGDIYNQELPECYTAILARFQVRANLVVPLLKGDELWGLLCIHQCSDSRQWQKSEIEFVTQIAIHLGVALQQAEFVAQLQMQSELLAQSVAQAVEREKAVAATIDKIRPSLNIDTIFATTTQEVRQLLKVDRVAIYRFNPDWSGEFVVESIAEGWTSLLQKQLEYPELKKNISECSLKHLSNPQFTDTHLQETEGGAFATGEMFRVCSDIYKGGFSQCYIEALESYQARAYAIIAIYQGKTLWGLLAAFQNSGVRNWEEAEISFLVQIGAQMGVAIQQAKLLAQTQKRSAELQTALTAELQKRAEELAREAERERALAQVIDKIRRTLELDTIFQTATTEVRKLLNADRVAVFRFDQNANYTECEIVSEDVLSPFDSALAAKVRDCCFGQYAVNYRVGHVLSSTDIYNQGMSACYIAMLSRFQVRANLVVPLFKGDELWGLLCIHQCSSPRQWQEKEIDFVRKIAVQLGVALQQAELLAQSQKRSEELQSALAEVQTQKEQQAKATEEERALARVIERIRRTLDIDTIFSTTAQEVRQILNCDRVVVYRFFSDWSGEFVAESVTDGWTPLVKNNTKTVWGDTYLQESQGGRYRNHQNFVVNDIYQANLSDCHIEILEAFQIKAHMVLPVFAGEKLWGLLGAYHNRSARHWTQRELNLLAQVSNQLGVAVQQAELLAQLKEAKENADAANRAKSNFLAHMSHELRTPLNSILGFTQVLARDTSLNWTQREHLEIIARSGEHLLTLLSYVLEMSKIEAGKQVLNESNFNIYHLLNSLEEMLQIEAESKGLQLLFEYGADVPQYVRTDEGKLRQVLINLLGNAIKFTQNGRVMLRVTIPLESQMTQSQKSFPCSLIFEVEDTGPGIAPSEVGNLFKAFVQTETGRRSQEGTGLGLSISKQFVQLMGGDITVNSVLGQGTVFRFNVQVELAEVSEIQTQRTIRQVVGLEPDQEAYRILVVDDRWESRRILVHLLAPLGFEVQEAENGQEAVNIWSRWQPHLIWMDMRMPGIDGYEATRRIRSSTEGQGVAIIALTATVLDRQQSVTLAAGCNDFVSKPFRQEVIFEKMAEHLGVRYVYEENSPTKVESKNIDCISTNVKSLHKALAAMPVDWVSDMCRAALSAREKQILQLIEQIPEEHVPLARALTQMVNNLQFDQIVSLTELSTHE